MIQPLETDTFLLTQKTKYEEVGVVLEGPEELKGKQVFFDSWLAKKYVVKGQEMWFVKYDDIVAYGEISA